MVLKKVAQHLKKNNYLNLSNLLMKGMMKYQN